MCITFMPIFRHDSPYYAPLSSSAWFIYSGTLSLVFRIFRWIVWSDYFAQRFSYSIWADVSSLQRTYDRWALQGITKTAEETVGTVSSEMVGRALKWTFESLYEDDELERFFASIPGFCSSKVVDDPQRSLAQLDSWMSAQALEVFLDHTWTSNLVSEAVKQRRLVICVRAADAARLYFASEWILRRVFSGRFRGVLQSVQMGRALGSNSIDGEMGSCAQSIVASIIANVRKRDSDWFVLAVDQLSVSEDVLRGYVSHGDDSVLLANLMHITRQIFLSANRDLVPQLHSILRSVSHFDVQNALPGLRHDFCTLWNEIVLEVQNKGSYTPILILVHTRHIYTALHQGADTTPAAFLASVDDADAILYQPFSYPLCNIPGHLSDPPSHIHERVDASTAEPALAPAAPSLAILHRDVVGTATAAKLSLNVMPRARPRLTPVSTSSRPAPLENYDLDGAAASATQGISDTSISSKTNTASHSTFSDASALRYSEETTIFPLSGASDSAIPIPASCSAVPVVLHPPSDAVVAQFDSISRRASLFPAAAPQPVLIVPQVTSAFSPDVRTSIGYLDAHDDTGNLKSPISMEVPVHTTHSLPLPWLRIYCHLKAAARQRIWPLLRMS